MLKFAVLLLALAAVVHSNDESITVEEYKMTPEEVSKFMLTAVSPNDRNTQWRTDSGWLSGQCIRLGLQQGFVSASAGMHSVRDVTYTGPFTNRISYVQAIQQHTAANHPVITRGGVGVNTVTVRFTSGLGGFFSFYLDVWGRTW